MASPAHAQSVWTWSSAAGGAWNQAANWTPAGVPNAVDAVVTFPNTPSGGVWTTNMLGGGTNTPFTFGTLNCSNTVVLNQAGAGVELIAATSSGTPILNVASGSLWLYPPIGGTQGFNKTGAGEVTFRYNPGTNPISGNIIISGGDLCLNVDANLGNPNNGLVISNNAKLLINPTTLAPVRLAASRAVTLACPAANFDVAGTNWLTIPGVIGENIFGQGGLVKTDAGTLELSGANTYSGGTTVNAGVLAYAGNGALGRGGVTVNAAGELACNANLNVTNALTLAGGVLSFNGGAGSFTGPITLSADSTVAMRSFTDNGAADGTLAGGVSGAANTLTLTNAGKLSFAAGAGGSVLKMFRNVGGNATLSSGTLTINTGSAPGNSAAGAGGFNLVGGGSFTNAGGTLVSSSGYFTPAGNGGGGNNVFTLQSGSVVNNGGEVLLAYAANGTLNVNGGLFDNGAQLFRVAQAATGVVNLNGGTLALNAFHAAGNAGTVNFNGGTLRANVAGVTLLPAFNTYAVRTGGAIIDVQANAVTAAGPLVAGSSPDGGLTKLGSGTLTLTATNAYNGPTVIAAGTLALGSGGRIAGTSGLQLNPAATLQFTLGAPGGPTNVVVNGSVTLAGTINVADAGITPDSVYPVIAYTGTLVNNGVTPAMNSPWAFTIDTSVPHLVRLRVTQKNSLVAFTNTDFAVSTTTTNLGGVLHGTPALPLWYEVRDQTNRLWDYGSLPAVSPWSITVRHLNVGTNTVTMFAQDTNGGTVSNQVHLVMTLGADPAVRPRPQPAEIWWGGTCHDNLYDGSGNIVGTYSRLAQLMQTNGWDYVKRYADGFFLHGYVWVNAVARMTNWQQVGASLSAQLAPFNEKYWLEDGWRPQTNNLNYGHSSATGQANDVASLLSVGLAVSEITEDFNPNWGDFSRWHPDWPTNDLRVLVTGNTNQASPAYPYASGEWRDYATDFHQLRPGIKFGWTWSPVWFHWLNGASLGTDAGIFSFSSGGTNYSFNWDFYDFMNDAAAIGSQTGAPFAFASDCPWDYYGQNPGNPGGWSLAQQLANRNKIRNYEAWLQNQNLRHTLICNYSQMNAANPNASDLAYEANSLSSLRLHQQEGGRAARYAFESWYQGPYTVVPETQPGSYTHLVLSALKYLKGIADTNGSLEPLNLTGTTAGTLAQLQLQNSGDVACLPALAGQPGSVPGVNTRYFLTNGTEITASVLTPEGLCFTNLLAPGAATNLLAVTLAGDLAAATNDDASLEAFWNPQDPLGIVRDRAHFTAPLQVRGGWQDADIGSVGLTGGSAISGGSLTLLGSGADVWGTADAFHFLCQTNSGDGVMIVRVSSQVAADAWSKAGIMIRENLGAGARNVFLAVTPNQGVSFQNRPAANGNTYSAKLAGPVAPYWLRLTRSGATFTAECSANGGSWVTLGSSNVTGFAASALWGLAVTAHNNTRASAAVFEQVTLPGPGTPPTLSAIADRTLIAGRTLWVTNAASDASVPPQQLRFSLLNAPPDAQINPTNGIISWRPAIAAAGTSNQFTVVVSQAGWVTTLGPVADALVQDGSYADMNFGTNPTLAAKASLVSGASRESYLQFNATNLPGVIGSATLQLTALSASFPGVQAVAAVTNNLWTESGLTWNNRPGSGAPLNTWTPQTGVPATADVTPALTDALANSAGLLSLRVFATNITADGLVNYGSREGAPASAPVLTVGSTNFTALSATQNFQVTVQWPVAPTLSSAALAGGTFTLTVQGDSGPDYVLQAATNLTPPVAWMPLQTNSAAVPPFVFTTAATNGANRFYRIKLGP